MSIASDMIQGIEDAFWLSAWADWAEESGEHLPRNITRETAPDAPPGARKGAKAWAFQLAGENHSNLNDIYERAVIAERRTVDPELLGYYLAMQGLGHGVSWFDDHEEFPIKVPRVEAHYDGEDLHVSMRQANPAGGNPVLFLLSITGFVLLGGIAVTLLTKPIKPE